MGGGGWFRARGSRACQDAAAERPDALALIQRSSEADSLWDSCRGAQHDKTVRLTDSAVSTWGRERRSRSRL